MTPQERAYQTGREFCPSVDIETAKIHGEYKCYAWIGDLYYETDPCKYEESAKAELRGFLEKLKEQIEEKLFLL